MTIVVLIHAASRRLLKMRLLGLSFLCDPYVRRLMTNYGFCSDGGKLSLGVDGEQVKDQAASESQTRQR